MSTERSTQTFLFRSHHSRRQRAIADYLDRETARLDALVAAKERVLGLLAEKRRALITRAVTRGLRPPCLPPRLRHPLDWRDSGALVAHAASSRCSFHYKWFAGLGRALL